MVAPFCRTALTSRRFRSSSARVELRNAADAAQDKTRQEKTSQDKARQDKTRQDKTRQDTPRANRHVSPTLSYVFACLSRAWLDKSILVSSIDRQSLFLHTKDKTRQGTTTDRSGSSPCRSSPHTRAPTPHPHQPWKKQQQQQQQQGRASSAVSRSTCRHASLVWGCLPYVCPEACAAKTVN